MWADFNPSAGHEQKGQRPAIVLSPTIFNKKVMLTLVALVTSKVEGYGFEVPFNGKKISGVVLYHQVKTIGFVERGLQFAEKAPAIVVSDVLAKVKTLVTE